MLIISKQNKQLIPKFFILIDILITDLQKYSGSQDCYNRIPSIQAKTFHNYWRKLKDVKKSLIVIEKHFNQTLLTLIHNQLQVVVKQSNQLANILKGLPRYQESLHCYEFFFFFIEPSNNSDFQGLADC